MPMCEYAAERVSPALDSLIAYPSAAYSHIAYPSTQQPTLHARTLPIPQHSNRPCMLATTLQQTAWWRRCMLWGMLWCSSSLFFLVRPLTDRLVAMVVMAHGCYGGDGAWCSCRYGIGPVDTPVYLNRVLRTAGHVTVREASAIIIYKLDIIRACYPSPFAFYTLIFSFVRPRRSLSPRCSSIQIP